MKPLSLIIIVVLLIFSCKKKTETDTHIKKESVEIAYESFGKHIIPDDAIAASSMAYHYKTMKAGDSVNSKMIAKVKDVCQAKGCWMLLDLGENQDMMVKFKDYGFFVPKNIVGKEVIVNGKAFVKEVSIEEQKHYAEDAGKTQEEIAQIIEPKRTYAFEADGVLLK